MKTSPFNTKILTRFFEGSLPEKEHLEVLDWLSSLSEEDQQDFVDAHLAVLDEITPLQETTAPSGFKQLVARIRKKEQNRTINLVLSIAAVTLPLLFMWFLFSQTNVQPAVVTAQYKAPSPRLIQVNNVLNQINTVQLPDSSSVALYPGASISYAAGLSGKKREISLTGKAFFAVKHNHLRPFTVQTGPVTTVVLGTSFWIDARSNTGVISVKVKTGKVGVVHASQSTVFLLPTEKAVFNPLNGALLTIKRANAVAPKQPVPAALPTAIAFNETPLKQVIKAIAENFKTEVILADSTAAYSPVSLNTRGKTITVILEEIKSQIPIDYEIKGKRITVRKKE